MTSELFDLFPTRRMPKKSKKKKLTLKDVQSLVDELNQLSGLTGDDCYILSEHDAFREDEEGVINSRLILKRKVGERSFVRQGQTITRPVFWRDSGCYGTGEIDGRGGAYRLLTTMIHAIQVASQSPKRTQ